MVREITLFPKHADRQHNQILSTSSGGTPVAWWMLTSSRPGWEGRGSPLQLELQPGRTESVGWWDIFIIRNQLFPYFLFSFRLSNLQSLPFLKASPLKQILPLSSVHTSIGTLRPWQVGNSSLQFKHWHFESFETHRVLWIHLLLFRILHLYLVAFFIF